MRLKKLIPGFLKPILKVIYIKTWGIYGKIKTRHKSRDELYQYWRDPWDDDNIPRDYLEAEPRSSFLLEIIKKYAHTSAKIMEIGCNVGRNLNYLFQAGFKNLEGIEISEKAVKILRESFPEMAKYARIYNAPVEEIIRDFKNNQFDVLFTMAVFEHIHSDSEWIFPQIARISKKFLITIEDEQGISWRHFPRCYKKVFEPLGMKQVEEIYCKGVEGLPDGFAARIFKKM